MHATRKTKRFPHDVLGSTAKAYLVIALRPGSRGYWLAENFCCGNVDDEVVYRAGECDAEEIVERYDKEMVVWVEARKKVGKDGWSDRAHVDEDGV